jgi:glycosyltransferase involved in cell wall biosynthesis
MPGKKNLTRVSVIIPTYNRSQLLRQTVESVLAQTYPNIEIIVVDDGSTDDTAAVMGQYIGRVTYIKETHGCGGRQRGFLVASGEYINFLDHDDLMTPTKIERQVQVLDSRPEIGLVHCGYYHIDKDGNILDKVGLLPEGDVLKELVCGNFIWSGAPLVRRQCLDQVGLRDAYCSDWDIWLRFAQAGYQFACVQEPLGAYRILPGSQMSNLAMVEQGSFAVLDQVFAHPELPADVVAVKEQAYGGMRFWIGCSYYAAELWDDARRNMAEALALRPQLLEHPEGFLQNLIDNVLDPEARISTPVKFIADVFDHLPSEAERLFRYRSHALSQLYVGLALRNYGAGKTDEAKCQLAEAIALDPTVLEHIETFADMVCHNAIRLPVKEPLVYADTVLHSLPTEARRFGQVRSRVLSEVSAVCAFQAYSAGCWRQVIRRVLTALWHRPSLLGNRGIISISLRSLLGLLTRRYSRQQNAASPRFTRGADSVPRVSVIVPTFNRAHLVCQAIDSVLAQTYREFEIVVVDDGSTDNTREVVSRYGECIRYIFQQNAGLSAARNTGIRASTGELLAFLDDDDTMSPTKLALQVAYLDERPDVGAVYCGWQVVSADGTTVLGEVRPTRKGEILKDLLLEAYLFPPVAIMIRRECIDRVGLFDETLPTCEDDDLWYRIAKAGYRFGCIEQPLCQYRTTPGSLGKDFGKLDRTMPIILQKVFDDPDLPADIAALRDEVYARRYLESGLRYLERSTTEMDAQMDSARHYLTKALALKPTILEERSEFSDILAHQAIELESNDPAAYIHRVINTLLSDAIQRRRLQPRLLGRLHVILAFKSHTARRRCSVVRHVLQGVWYDPNWLRNRGVVSVFLRSLLPLSFKPNNYPLPQD